MEPRSAHPRDLRLVAVILLVIAQTMVFSQVFLGMETALLLTLGALLAVGVGVVMRRHNLVLAAITAIVGYLLVLPAIAFTPTTWFLLPTGRTLVALRAALQVVGDQARTQIAPTRPTEALVMAGLAAVWAAGFSCHALLIRARSPFLSMVPGLAMIVFTELVLGALTLAWYSIALLGACVFVLFADGNDRAHRSGTVVGLVPRRMTLTGTTAGRRMGAAIMGIAVLVSLLVRPGPGFAAEGTGPISDVDPLVSVSAQLHEEHPTPLFEVVASQGAYWRTTTLDDFDGISWSRSPDVADAVEPISTATALTRPPRDKGVRVVQLQQAITLQGWRGGSIPLAPEPTVASSEDLAMSYNPVTGVISVDGPQGEGNAITVVSEIAVPDPAQLDAIDDTMMTEAADPAWYERYTELPTVFPERVRRITEQVTQDEPNPYRRLLALQAFLRSSAFTYDEDATVPEGADPLVYFLDVSRAGFCQQFAGSFTAMARSLGYPARIAIGFQPGAHEEAGDGAAAFAVTSHEAHAWPEVYFPGIGWTAFEPTPSRSNPVAQNYLSPPSFGSVTNNPRTTEPNAGPVRDPSVRPEHKRDADITLNGDAVSANDGLTPWLSALLVAGIFVLLALLWRPIAHLARRLRARAHRPSDPVLAAWDRFERHADDWGFGRSAGETVHEFSRRLEAQVPHVQPLASVTIEAAYGPGDDAGGTGGSEGDAKRAIQELRSVAGIRRRVGGWYRPMSASSPYPSRLPSRRREGP